MFLIMEDDVKPLKSFTEIQEKIKNLPEDWDIALLGWFSEKNEIAKANMINEDWIGLNSSAWCNYENNPINDSLYGKLYNWYTTYDFRKVCPSNWHVPTDADWDVLIGFIDEAYNPIPNGAQSAIAGGKMKSISGWIPFTGVTSNNESGFSGLPGGYRFNSTGVFFSIGYYGNWWSSSGTGVDTGPALYRYLAYGNSNYYRQSSSKKFGYSVRCIKD
jgi:uncharacterized protein (TIGR02145 family)